MGLFRASMFGQKSELQIYGCIFRSRRKSSKSDLTPLPPPQSCKTRRGCKSDLLFLWELNWSSLVLRPASMALGKLKFFEFCFHALFYSFCCTQIWHYQLSTGGKQGQLTRCTSWVANCNRETVIAKGKCQESWYSSYWFTGGLKSGLRKSKVGRVPAFNNSY